VRLWGEMPGLNTLSYGLTAFFTTTTITSVILPPPSPSPAAAAPQPQKQIKYFLQNNVVLFNHLICFLSQYVFLINLFHNQIAWKFVSIYSEEFVQLDLHIILKRKGK
jgi:hypothetical protein